MRFLNLLNFDRVTRIHQQTVGFQKVLKFTIDEECRRKGMNPYFKEVNTGGVRKSYRIERLQPYFERGKIFFRSDLRYLHELKAEILGFPTTKHDDMLDALATQIELIREGRIELSSLPENSFEAYWQRKKSKKSTSGYGHHKLRRKDNEY